MNIRFFASSVLIVLTSPLALAATQGTLGTTSTGDTDVSITLNEEIQVSGIADINLTYTAGSDSNGSSPLCIYRRNDADIDLTLSSANESGSTFRLTDGTAFLNYAVALSGDDVVASFGSSVTETLANADTSSTSCGGTPGHSIDVTVTAAVLDAAQAGTYTDTITILAEPI